jgi:hypothetical protein
VWPAATDIKRLEITPPAGQDHLMFDQCAHRVPTRRGDAISLANRSNNAKKKDATICPAPRACPVNIDEVDASSGSQADG